MRFPSRSAVPPSLLVASRFWRGVSYLEAAALGLLQFLAILLSLLVGAVALALSAACGVLLVLLFLCGLLAWWLWPSTRSTD